MNRRFFNQQNLTRRLRLLPVLFAMLLMPLSAWAEDYDLWIGDIQVTDANKGNVLGDGTVSFSQSVGADVGPTYTLTLNGAELTAPIKVGLTNLTIDIQGTNSITTGEACIQNTAASFVPSLTFKSTSEVVGSLTLTDTDENGTNGVISDVFFEHFTINNKLALVLLRYGNYSSNTYYFSAGEVHNAQLVPSYGVQVNDMQIYEGNATNVLGDNKVSFDKTTHTLTLNNVSGIEAISTTLSTLDIDLVGSNTLYRGSNGSLFESASGEAVTINLKSTNATGALTMKTQPNSGATLIGGNVTLTPVDPVELLTNGAANNQGTMVYGVDYGLTVADVPVRSVNASNVLGDETATVVFTPADNTTSPATPATLTLNGAGNLGTILSGLENLRVVINGENAAVQVSSPDVSRNITFAGGTNGGSLTITAGNDESAVSGFASVSYDGAYAAADVPFGYDKTASQQGYRKSHMSGDNSYLNSLTITTVPHYPIWLYTGTTILEQINNTNKNTLLSASGNVSFDGNHTLSLKNSVNCNARIVSGLSELTISVDGDCIIVSPDTGSVVRSINASAPLTIEKASGASSASLKLAAGSHTAINAFASLDYTGLILLSEGATYSSGSMKDSNNQPLYEAIFTSSLKKPTLRMYYPDVDNFSGNPYYKFVNPNGGGTVKYSRFFASESINDDINQTYNDGTFDVMIDYKWAPVVCKVWVEANGSVSDPLYACRLGFANMEATYGDTNVPAPTLLPQTVDGVTTTYALRDPDNETHHANIASDGTISLLSPGLEWLKATFTVGDGVEYIKNASDEVPSADFYIVVKPSKPTLSHETGSYVGTQTVTFTDEFVDNQNITAWYYTYEGEEPANPTVNPVPDGGIPVSSSENVAVYYQLGYENGDNSTLYAYSETTKIAITILKDIDNCTVTGNDNVTYTGAAQTPTITVTPAVGGEALVLGTDYTVSYKKGDTAVESMIDAGDYTIVITAKEGSAYGGTKEVGFTIAQAKLSAVTIAAIDDQTFTGSQITPAVTVTFNEKTVSTEEYNVVYGENKNVGEGAGTVTLTSKNKNFVTSTDADATTKQTATFNIVAATAAITATDQTVTFDGEEQPFTNYTIANGEAVVTYYSSEEARTAKTGGTTNAPTNAAIYYVQVTQGDDNYTSAPANATFTISPKALTEGMVEQDGVSFTYSGYTPEYSVSVKDGEEYLAGDDYDCVIKQGGTEIIPVNAGSYDVVVTGKRNYTGTITKTFTINPKDLSEDNIVGNLTATNFEYDGEAHMPTLGRISYNGHDLEYSVDYLLAYPDSVNAGTGMEETEEGVAKGPRCEIIGKGNFTGKVIKYFTIAQADFNVEIADIPEQTATGEPIEPELTVTFRNTNNNVITVDASDYRAEYSNNVNPGTATVILSSTGKNFTTELTQTKTFIINSIKDYLSIKDGEAFLSKLRVTNGNTFDVKAHYQVCPEDIPAANLTWESADDHVVSVDNGVLTAEGYGNVKITLSYAGGGKYEEDTYDFYVDAAPKTPTISLPAGTYPSDQGAITMTKEDAAGMAISYTWDDITGDNAAAWSNYADEGVVFQEGTLSARVGYTPAAGGTTIYSDTVSVVYTIVDPKEITADMVTLEKDAYDYTGSAIIPDVKVYDSEKGAYLVKDTDFELSCENNTNVGTATVTVTGKVNYKGSVEKTFEIIYRASGEQFDAAIGDNTYGTFFDNTNDTYLPDGYSAYFITGVSGTTATTQSLTYIPKGSAAIVAKTASTGATAPGEGNMMIHMSADTDVTTMAGTIYGLYQGKLMKVTMGTIAAGKNVLQVAGGSGAPELSISIGDENTTGVQTLNVERGTLNDDSWYTIDGRKLQQAPAQKGLYIKNGKKVVIK